MSIAPNVLPTECPTAPERAEGRLVFHNVSWKTYETLVDELAEQHLRLTYDRGELEIMAPSRRHESRKRRLGRLVETIAEESGVRIEPGGSMTFKRHGLLRGLEPDECFWIANEPLVRGREEYDIERDPPPDLVIEIDVTSDSFDRLPLYAAIRVPEIWRYDGQAVSVHCLDADGVYAEREKSPTFPRISIERLVDFLEPDPTLDYLSVIREFRQWVRAQLAVVP